MDDDLDRVDDDRRRRWINGVESNLIYGAVSLESSMDWADNIRSLPQFVCDDLFVVSCLY